MARRVPAGLVAAIAVGVFGVGRAAAATVAVCSSGCPYSQIAAAVVAASAGDTVRVAPGVYAGGFSITKDLVLAGSGAGRTIVRGGGPVITIGEFEAAVEPTVSLSGFTITGGVTDSNVFVPGFAPGVWTAGGGIYVPLSVGGGLGASVRITDSVIAGNRVVPSVTIPDPFVGPPLLFAASDGGGIATFGTMTLERVAVIGNDAGGGPASGVGAGGIYSGGPLILRSSIVSGNRSHADPPNGYVAYAGGILQEGATLSITDSEIIGNSTSLVAFANAPRQAEVGGVVNFGGPATIRRTLISGNSATSTNTGGEPDTIGGGVANDSPTTMEITDSTIAYNTVTAVSTFPSALSFAAGGGVLNSGTMTIDGSRVIGNRARATGAAASIVNAQGGGIWNVGTLTLTQSSVSGNSATASGATGFAQGGGISNAVPDPSFPAPHLTLTSTLVTGNALNASAGITRQGGGLFTNFPVTLTQSSIRGNQPDQCFGC
jgi:hypothetical protein